MRNGPEKPQAKATFALRDGGLPVARHWIPTALAERFLPQGCGGQRRSAVAILLGNGLAGAWVGGDTNARATRSPLSPEAATSTFAQRFSPRLQPTASSPMTPIH